MRGSHATLFAACVQRLRKVRTPSPSLSTPRSDGLINTSNAFVATIAATDSSLGVMSAAIATLALQQLNISWQAGNISAQLTTAEGALANASVSLRSTLNSVSFVRVYRDIVSFRHCFN